MVEEAAAAAKAAAAAADAAAAELRAVCAAAARAMGTAPSVPAAAAPAPVGRVLHGASPLRPSAADDDAPAAAAAATAALAAAANARSAARAARENEAIVTDSPTATEDDEATVRQAVGYRARGPAGHAWGAPSPPRAPMAYAAADGSIHRAPQPLVNYDSVDPAVHSEAARTAAERRPALSGSSPPRPHSTVHKHMPAEEAPAAAATQTVMAGEESLAVIDGDVQLWESKLADQAARIAALQDKFTGAVMPPPPPAAPSEPAAPARAAGGGTCPEAPPAEAPKPRRRGPPKPWSDDARRHGKPRYGHTLGGSKRPQGGPPWTEEMGNPVTKETSGDVPTVDAHPKATASSGVPLPPPIPGAVELATERALAAVAAEVAAEAEAEAVPSVSVAELEVKIQLATPLLLPRRH